MRGLQARDIPTHDERFDFTLIKCGLMKKGGNKRIVYRTKIDAGENAGKTVSGTFTPSYERMTPFHAAMRHISTGKKPRLEHIVPLEFDDLRGYVHKMQELCGDVRFNAILRVSEFRTERGGRGYSYALKDPIPPQKEAEWKPRQRSTFVRS